VIGFDVPDIESSQVDAELARTVRDMWPQFLGFAVSFWVIARYWTAHHRVFRFITDYDRGLISLNTLFLMFIAFMPFATSLLFTYPGQLVSVAMYAGAISAMGLTLFWMWVYATRGHRLVSEGLSESTIKSGGQNLIVAPIAFLASIGIALFDPALAMYSWIFLIPLFSWFMGRHKGADAR
jgi:uncharacterized membrane protein